MIKKLSFLVITCFITMAIFAQQPVTITGQLKFEKLHIKPVKLFKVSNGTLYQIAETNPTADGRFGFIFYPEYEGLYVVGTGGALSPMGNYKYYLKPGDKLSVSFSDWDYALTGSENSKENEVLYQWHKLTDGIYQKAINLFSPAGRSTYVDFFPDFKATEAKTKNWFQGKETGNAKFNKEMPGIMRMDMATIGLDFLRTPRAAYPSVEEFIPYYNNLHTQDFTRNTHLIYSYPWGIHTIDFLTYLDLRKAGKKYTNPAEWLKENLALIPNDTLKGDVVLNSASRFKDYGQFTDFMSVYGKYILTDSQKVKQTGIAANLPKYKRGDRAYNFSYPDVNGNTISLASLKGKVVMVDVWATWCGPCKAEIPHLKKLEEEMKGKKVEFVSISVDELKDKKKWEHFIDTAHLGGTQLFAGGWDHNSGIAAFYKISSIPRFLVFDQKGNIVSADSPRPSNPALKEMLEKMLAQ